MATEQDARALGFRMPTGDQLISDGDDVIRANAVRTVELVEARKADAIREASIHANQKAAEMRDTVYAAAQKWDGQKLVEAKTHANQKAAEIRTQLLQAIEDSLGRSEATATTAKTAAEAGARRAGHAEARAQAVQEIAEAITERMAAIEAMSGLTPGEPTDAQTANLVTQDTTATRTALERVITARTLERHRVAIVEDYARPEDTSDDQAWQRAADAVADSGGWTLRATRTEYRFANPVELPVADRMMIEGAGNLATTITVATGLTHGPHGLPSMFRCITGTGGYVGRFHLRNLRFDGGMISAPAGPARDQRVFHTDFANNFIRLNGNLTPGEESNAEITDVVLEDVEMYGCRDLPVLFRGCHGVTLRRCRFERTMDPGLTHCKRITITDFENILGADNGISISRGCETVFLSRIRIDRCYLAGIHLGGYKREAGPKRVIASSLLIDSPGTWGISLAEGPQDVTISDFQINDVARGHSTRAHDDNGVGINIRGLEEVQGGGVELEPARNIRIHDGTIARPANSGILFKFADGITISGVDIFDAGSDQSVKGAEITATNGQRNIGIGVAHNKPDTARNVRIHDVRIADTRTVPLTNWAIRGSGETWTVHHVTAQNTRNPYTEEH